MELSKAIRLTTSSEASTVTRSIQSMPGYLLFFNAACSNAIKCTQIRNGCLYTKLMFYIICCFVCFSSIQDGYSRERTYHTIVVYSDGWEDYFDELVRFMEIVPDESRKKVINGDVLGRDVVFEESEGFNLIYFGRSKSDEHLWRDLPIPLRELIQKERFVEEIIKDEYPIEFQFIEITEILCSLKGEFNEEHQIRVDAAFNPQNLQECREEHYSLLARLQTNLCNKVDCSVVFRE